MQNNRIMRQDEHKRALVAKGTDLLKFFVVTEDQIEILTDTELYTEGEQDDIRLIIQALDSVQRSLMLYSDQHHKTVSKIKFKNKRDGQNPEDDAE